MSTNNNEYLNSLQHIITSLNDDKIRGLTTAAPTFGELKDPQTITSEFNKLQDNINTKNVEVLLKINEMKTKLSNSNKANKEFMDILSKNLQYYNKVVKGIINKIKQIFQLIKSLDITKGSPSPYERQRGQPQTPEQNEDLIKGLVDTINKYLTQFNILKSYIDTVVGNNNILRKELSEKSNDLFGNIKELDELFVTLVVLCLHINNCKKNLQNLQILN